jgi:hypothetical protein
MSESERKKAIVDALAAMGVIAWVNHAGRVKVRGGYMNLSAAGTPDVIAIVRPSGRLLGLEVKDEKGRERPAQTAWAHGARHSGAYVRTVRTPQEAVNAYHAAQAGDY